MRGKKNTPPVLCDERVRICGALAGNLDVGSSEWLDLEGGAPTGTSRPGRRRVKGDVERELRRSRCHGWRCTTWSHWLTTCRNSSLCACRGVMCVFWPAIVALSKHSKPRTACALHGGRWRSPKAKCATEAGNGEEKRPHLLLAVQVRRLTSLFPCNAQRHECTDYCTVGRWQPTRQRREGAGEVVADVANSAGDVAGLLPGVHTSVLGSSDTSRRPSSRPAPLQGWGRPVSKQAKQSKALLRQQCTLCSALLTPRPRPPRTDQRSVPRPRPRPVMPPPRGNSLTLRPGERLLALKERAENKNS